MPLPLSADDPISAALLEAMRDRGVQRTYAAQAIPITEGDRSDALYVVLAGRLKVYASSEDGRHAIRRKLPAAW